MAKVANFDPDYDDALGGTVAVIADAVTKAAVTEHAADTETAHQGAGIAIVDQGTARHWPMLALSSGASNAGHFAADDVEGALAEIGAALGMDDTPVRHWPMLALSSGSGPGVVPHLSKPAAHAAGNVSIVDAGSYFAGTDVESALQQVGAAAGALPGVVGGYAPLSSGLLVPVGYLGSGTPDATTFLRGDGAWAVPPGGAGSTELLGVTAYAPGTDTTIASTSSGSDADVDATNLTLSVTVPANGKLLLRFEALAYCSGSGVLYWTIREGTTTLATSYALSSVAGASRYSATRRLTGLTPGVHTYKWGFYRSAGTGSIYGGPTSGQAVMEAWSVP